MKCRDAIFAAAMLLAITLPAQAGIAVQAWGGVAGKGVDLFILTNAKGMEARITNYGAVITAIRVPGRSGKPANVVQGFDSLADYTSQDYKGRYGAVIGRYANRIKDDSYTINNVTYHVARDAYVLKEANNKPYDERVWSAVTKDGDEPQLILSLLDRNGTMGFPGTLRVQVTYTLTRNNVLRIDYRARSDKDTIISLTNHAYFNMAGDASGPVLDQLLTVNADAITVGDDKNVPTGTMRKVAGTAFDFRTPTPIGAHIHDPDPAIQRAGGFDQNYAINGAPGILRLAARLEDPKSGRMLEEWTTQAGLQVYSANYTPPTVAVTKGYGIHSAVALEAQAFPNAPNIPSFPSALLAQDTVYSQTTEYRFSVTP
ncbi:MAG TPA: aldose epimerase family protein [Rhizomicrobium sp.]|nr:aldose epimerase family protein [Rhizomicrobium sp.]